MRAWIALSLGIASATLVSAAHSQATAIQQPWMDQSLSADARAELIQSQMTQDEQLLMLKGYYGANVKISWIKPAPVEIRPLLPGSAGYVPGVSRLGIPALHETDAGVGIANTNWMRPGDTATAFPSGLSNAATWNPALTFAIGSAIGAEARDRGFNVVLDGAINLARDPRGGRTFEYAGEDPLLAGAVVGEQIRGIQSQHVISSIKHFALNDQEIGRGVLSANIDESAARESDLLAFEIAIEHGNPGSVMCSYNRFNGVYACENQFLLTDVLKHDWTYPGWVLSDWGGVHSTVAAANAGLDQESASGFDRQEFFGDPLSKAVTDGTVTKARLHDMVHRILRTMFSIGLMDFPMTPQTPSTHVDVAERGAEEGIVLLKNAQNILPLTRNIRSILIVGAHANVGMLSGGGSSQVVPLGHNPDNEVFVGGAVRILPGGAPVMPLGREIYDPPSPLAEIAREAPHAKVRYIDGGDVAATARQAAAAQIVVVFAQQWMTEGDDVPSLSLPGKQNELIRAVAAANPHTIVVLETGGPVVLPWLEQVPAVLESWYAGSGGATALARILFGDVNPSGRLPLTFPLGETQLPRPLLPDRSLAGRPFDVNYSEGADVGYRWFAQQKLEPLFPFGFGLSYTTYAFDKFETQVGETLTASVSVTNTGEREGSETVQLYATPPTPGAVGRLVGWNKVELRPGETKVVSIDVEARRLAHFDRNGNVWRIEPGSYTFNLGRSAIDIVASTQVTLAPRELKP